LIPVKQPKVDTPDLLLNIELREQSGHHEALDPLDGYYCIHSAHGTRRAQIERKTE
jgi:hypothetical protein